MWTIPDETTKNFFPHINKMNAINKIKTGTSVLDLMFSQQ
jgi:hypothetical protein